MTLEKIKNNINNNVNVVKKFKYNGSRNQVEEFDGKIVNTYKFVFIIEMDNKIKRYFSYSDILNGSLIME